MKGNGEAEDRFAEGGVAHAWDGGESYEGFTVTVTRSRQPEDQGLRGVGCGGEKATGVRLAVECIKHWEY